MCEREETKRLVGLALEGDESAFGLLFRRFRPTAVLVASGVGADREVAEDAVQDSFVTAFRSLRNLEDPGSFGPWLMAIVRNRTRRLAREHHRYHPVPLDALDHLQATPVAPPEVGASAIQELPTGIRESMQLYYLQGWSVGEIAALLERPVTTVKWQLHAGRALLRKRLGEEDNLS